MAIKPLADTQRIVDWEELPDSVKSIPESFDPLAEGVWMKHQVEWIKTLNSNNLAVCEKCRRSGITLATAQDDTITAASSKKAGGANIFYIGDTQEKGLEYIGYCAKMAKSIVKQQGQVSAIEQFIFEDQAKRGEATQQITAFRIRFASGFRIVALSSRPENIHGLQGKVRIDEAALHKDVRKVLESATALLIWGGSIAVFSTHRGARNPFNDLVRDVNNGQYGDSAKVYKITFDECVENGIYERICFMQGKPATPEGKQEWYANVRKAYGPRKAAMREELDTIPREGEGTVIPGIWIQESMKENRPVLRWNLDDDFNKASPEKREHEATIWIARNLEPLFDLLDPELEHYFGMDFARKGHLSVIVPIEKQINLVRKVPWAIELHNCPTRQQEQILWHLIPKLPRFNGGAMDGTGPGQTLAEYTVDKFSQVESVTLNDAWYKANMTPFVQTFEDGLFDLPRDAHHESDLRDLERIDGIVKLPKQTVQQKAEEDEVAIPRHGDYAMALCLAEFKCRNPAPMPSVASRRPRESNQIMRGYA